MMMLRAFFGGLGFLIGFFLVDYLFFDHTLLKLILSSIFSFLGGTALALLFYWLASQADGRR